MYLHFPERERLIEVGIQQEGKRPCQHNVVGHTQHMLILCEGVSTGNMHIESCLIHSAFQT